MSPTPPLLSLHISDKQSGTVLMVETFIVQGWWITKAFFSFLFFLVHSITSANLPPPLTSGVRYPTIISFLSYLLIPKAKIPPTRENICTSFTL